MKVPIVVDDLMRRAGAERLVEAGLCDTAGSDIFSELEAWMQGHLWAALAKKYNVEPAHEATNTDMAIKVTVGEPPRAAMRRGFIHAVVTESRLLSAPRVAQKRHLTLRFPPDVSYQTGDRVQVLPKNSATAVQRVLSRFQLDRDALLTISSARSLGLPTDTPIAAADLFAAYVELGQGASPRNIQALADASPDLPTKSSLQKLADDTELFEAEVRAQHVSVLDLLERFPTVALPLSTFLSMLPQMRPRTYSLSSAPSHQPGHGTLTYTVVGPDPDGGGSDGSQSPIIHGVASNYLASLDTGHVVDVSLFPAQREFRLPAPGTPTPVIMIATGAGLAPFRGFVQERAALQAAGQHLGPALLFFGCRGPKLDDMYRDELDMLERAGVVVVRRAYSREPVVPSAAVGYIQDRIWEERTAISTQWAAGAVVYVCSGKKVSDAVFEVLGPVLYEADQRAGRTTAASVEAWAGELPRERYVMEIFN
jgi:cytochrome P450 / NADPH-cytochrome P450 reductase